MLDQRYQKYKGRMGNQKKLIPYVVFDYKAQ